MPYILKPIIHRAIWGGKRLSNLITNCPEDLAHLYLATAHNDMVNHVIHSHMDLQELFVRRKSVWKMEQFNEFPLTIALVDATENLSIQVHPDANLAETMEGKRIGKTESWLFLETPRAGWIYAGCNINSADEIKAAIERDEIEKVVTHFNVGYGDCVCVRDGTLHALTAGSLVYEIEFGSNYTYRFYDYNRRDKNGNTRRLDVEKALQAIDIDKKPVVTIADESGWHKENEYELKILRTIKSYKNDSDRLECLSVIKGSGVLNDFTIGEPVAILLEPGEEVRNMDLEFAIVSRLGEQNVN